MIKSAIFIANQLFMQSMSDVLYKIGMYTAFMKDSKTSYDFAGKILYEDKNIVIFAGKPKRISIDGENLTEMLFVERTDEYLGLFQIIKQTHTVDFKDNCFTVDGIEHYSLNDLRKLAYAAQMALAA